MHAQKLVTSYLLSVIFFMIIVIECDGNFDASGNCKEGYLAPDCCNCDPTGNDTHAFYEDDNGQCIRKL